jgi:uncharacterized membrane protein YphA (DoxX/SURF4 family)
MPKKIATWCLTVPLAALFLLAGAGKFGAEATANFERFGYSDAFRVFIGIAEVAGGIGLLVPRLATWAAAGLVVIMAGAVYTHVMVGIRIAFPAVVGALLAALAVLRFKDALFLASPRPPALDDGTQSATPQRPAA